MLVITKLADPERPHMYRCDGRNITAAEVSLLASVMPPTWQVDFHPGYDGGAIALLASTTAGGPIYCLWWQDGRLTLWLNREDGFQQIGRFASLLDMLVGVAGILWAEQRPPCAGEGALRIEQAGDVARPEAEAALA
jgi:hypothetical protein